MRIVIVALELLVQLILLQQFMMTVLNVVICMTDIEIVLGTRIGMSDDLLLIGAELLVLDLCEVISYPVRLLNKTLQMLLMLLLVVNQTCHFAMLLFRLHYHLGDLDIAI